MSSESGSHRQNADAYEDKTKARKEGIFTDAPNLFQRGNRPEPHPPGLRLHPGFGHNVPHAYGSVPWGGHPPPGWMPPPDRYPIHPAPYPWRNFGFAPPNSPSEPNRPDPFGGSLGEADMDIGGDSPPESMPSSLNPQDSGRPTIQTESAKEASNTKPSSEAELVTKPRTQARPVATKKNIPEKKAEPSLLESPWSTERMPPPHLRFLVPLQADASDNKVLEFLGSLKEQAAKRKRAEAKDSSEVEKAMLRIQQKIREKQEEINRANALQASQNSATNTTTATETGLPSKAANKSNSAPRRTEVKSKVSSETNMGEYLVVVDEEEMNGVTGKAVEDEAERQQNDKKQLEDQISSAESARSRFMRDETMLKDSLSKLHQTEAQLQSLQRGLDDAAYAETSANVRIKLLQEQLRRQTDFLENVKQRHRQLLVERDETEAKRIAQKKEFERIQQKHDADFAELVSLESDVEALQESIRSKQKNLAARRDNAPKISPRPPAVSAPPTQASRARSPSPREPVGSRSPLPPDVPLSAQESKLREMLLQSIGNKPKDTPTASGPMTKDLPKEPAAKSKTATTTDPKVVAKPPAKPLASSRSATTTTAPKPAAAVPREQASKKRPREPEPSVSNKKPAPSTKAPSTSEAVLKEKETVPLKIQDVVKTLIEPHWWAKAGASTFSFNLHTMIPLVAYLKDPKSEPIEGLTRFLNTEPLPSVDNPFTLLGSFPKGSRQQTGEGEGESEDADLGVLQEYTSPLMLFKSYRLNPNYPFKLNSNTHSHKLDPYNFLCKFDLHGICNDDECPYQHLRDYQLSEKDLFFDLADYITAAPAVDADTQSLTAEEKKRLLDSMGSVVVEAFSEHTPRTVHNKAADLIKKVNKIRHEVVDKETSSDLVLGRRRHLMKNMNKNKKSSRPKKGASKPAPSTTAVAKPQDKAAETTTEAATQTVESELKELEKLESDESMESSYEDEEDEDLLSDFVQVNKKATDMSDDEWNDDVNTSNRYWESDTPKEQSSLEEATVTNPHDPRAWLAYAFHGVDKDGLDPAIRNRVLAVLSRGLEKNRNSTELWIPYLYLFKGLKEAKMDDLAKLSLKAAKFCKDSVVLWLFCASLPVHDTQAKRLDIYTQALSTLVKCIEEKPEPTADAEQRKTRLSWGIFVTLVHLMQAYLDGGDLETAKTKLKELLWKSGSDGPVLTISAHIPSLILPSHLCLLLLYYVHLLFFGVFPDPSNLQRPITDSADPVRFNSMMIINWAAVNLGCSNQSGTEVGLSTAKDLRQAFEDCLNLLNKYLVVQNDKNLSLPIEVNYLLMELSLCSRSLEAVRGTYYRSLCQRFLRLDPKRIILWYLYACGEDVLDKQDAAEKIFSKSLTHYPQGFLLWYHRIVCALKRGQRIVARELLAECVLQFVDKTSVSDSTATFSFICSAYARLLNISDYTLGGRNSKAQDWIHLKFNIPNDVQRNLRQDIYLWLLFFLFLADHEVNRTEYPGEEEEGSTKPVTTTPGDEEEDVVKAPTDVLSVVFKCALYRLQNKQDQELLWVHYMHYKTVKGTPTEELFSLLERYLNEQGGKDGPENCPTYALLVKGMDEKICLPSYAQLKSLVPGLLFRNRTVSNIILKLVLSQVQPLSWPNILNKLIQLQPNNQFLLRTATEYCLNRIAGQSLSTKHKSNLGPLLEVLLQKHPLSTEPSTTAQARTTTISTKSIRHHLRFCRSLHALAAKYSRRQELNIDSHLALIAFSLLCTSQKEGEGQAQNESIAGDLTLLLDLCVKSIDTHPTHLNLWKALDFIKTAMVIKGFGQVPTTFSSKLIPPQPVGTIDVKQIAHSVGVSL